MPDTPPPKIPPADGARNVSLAIKDSLREIRFETHRSTKRWLQGIDGIVSNIPKIGPPLGAATKTASELLQFADRMAVDLFSTENMFRRGDFRMPSPDFYVSESVDSSKEKLFIKNHFWAIKHLIKLTNNPEFLVSEEAIFQAQRHFILLVTDKVAQSNKEFLQHNKISETSKVGASIVYSLYRSQPLSLSGINIESQNTRANTIDSLTSQVCVSAVLASLINVYLPQIHSKLETLEALKLAGDTYLARLESWNAAMTGENPVQRIAQELDFTLRHI